MTFFWLSSLRGPVMVCELYICHLQMLRWFSVRHIPTIWVYTRLIHLLLSVSDLKMNLAKFELLPIGDAENVESLVSVLGCMVAGIPMTYWSSFGSSFQNRACLGHS